MGGDNTKIRSTGNQDSDRQSGKRCTIDDFKKTFRKHYDQVNAFRHVTSDQEQVVNKLSDILAESSNEDDEEMKRKMDKLKELQSTRNSQCRLLYESVMELYSNINCILRDNNLTTLDINSNNQDNSPEFIKLKRSVQLLSSEKKKLKEENSKLKELLQSQKETPQQEQSNQRPPKEMGTVQLYHSHSGKTIHEIEVSLEEMLNVHFNQVKLMKSHKLDDVDPSKVLVILSITTTRVGTDAKHALEGIKNPANTALVLIHIKEEHALPRQDSSAILTDEKFKALGGIFDLAFMHEKGIYHCEMNNASLEGIYSFIKQNTKSTYNDTVCEVGQGYC